MPLSWNEIRTRATTFAREWSNAQRENVEAQTFWNEFFDIFGVRRRTVASFEEPVRNLGGAYDRIDLFWKGRLIAESKTRGRDLDKAHTQAMGYIQSLHSESRGDEAPRYILVSDFAHFALHDLEPEEGQPETIQFLLSEFPDQIRHFAFIAGYETRRLDAEDPANLQATERLANLHDRLEDGGFTGHDLERFMVRILFCMFAEDTGIFEPAAFTNFITHHTRPDGSDTGAQLGRFFDVLNTPKDRRQRNLDEDLAALEYVNGDLFAERLNFADFNAPMRTALLACCNFRWEKISPAVFGSLFQSIMQPRQRRQIGAHYTSERDIMKLIRSLFLDDLRQQFNSIRRDRRALERFHRELGQLKFLDPACGCGNFLVIAYRELRRLEFDLLQALHGDRPEEVMLWPAGLVTIAQMFGIEIEEWPVRIAEVAMWLMDHQMNAELFARFGKVRATTPLTRSAHIVQGNALRLDWNEVLAAAECSYVLGNPPFVGKHLMNADQESDVQLVANGVRGAGVLDYVCAWYFKAASYTRGRTIPIAFVSTNSIAQGEQVGVLWNELFRHGAKIHFAHRTFVWMSEARGRAHVHVVIIGWGLFDRQPKKIFDYEGDSANPAASDVTNISPYLVEGSDSVVMSRSRPLSNVPACTYGSKPADGGALLVEDQDRESLLNEVSEDARRYIRPLLCAQEYLYGIPRWCLWLVDAAPTVIRQNRAIRDRVEACRAFREKSDKLPTRELANSPTLFAEIRQPPTSFLVVPQHTSESRRYVPFGFFGPRNIVHNSCSAVPGATGYHFGVLSSFMHMVWVRHICGRIKSDFRYSTRLVYNNFPWPQDATEAKRQRVQAAAQSVLDARKQFPDATLADLYDPNAMPPVLRRAHDALDRAVDRCYRQRPFTTERQRLEYLFNLYEQLVAPLVAPRRPPRTRPR